MCFVLSFQIANNPCSNLLTAHFRLDGHPHVNFLHKVIQGNNQTYLFFAPSQVGSTSLLDEAHIIALYLGWHVGDMTNMTYKFIPR